MDWDGIGTFALFLASGAVGLGLIALRAYKAKLASMLAKEKLKQASNTPEHLESQIQHLEAQVHRLTERVDFTERLLGDGRETTSEVASTE